MTNSDLVIQYESHWEWYDSDGECCKCDQCKDLIVGKKWTLYLFVESTLHKLKLPGENPIEVSKFCSSCHDCLKDYL